MGAAVASTAGELEIVDRSDARGRLGAALLAVLACLAGSVWAFGDTLDRPRAVEVRRVVIPVIEGLPIETARERLEGLGFVVDLAFQPNERVERGLIIGQKPLAGRRASQGEVVTIVASDGPLGLMVPGVVGQQGPDALTSLAALGINGVAELEYGETIRVGEVVRTEPFAGTRIPLGGTVRVFVSGGPAPRAVPVLIGKPLEQALAELGRSGLAVGKITRPFRADQVPGTVLEVPQIEGTLLPKGMPVDLVVAGPEPTAAVPFLVGLQRSTAEGLLGGEKLKVSVLASPVPIGDSSAGTVLAQGYPPTTKLALNTVVQITVAVEEAPPTTVAPAPTPAPTPSG